MLQLNENDSAKAGGKRKFVTFGAYIRIQMKNQAFKLHCQEGKER